MAKRKQKDDLLKELLAEAGPETLAGLIAELADGRPEVRRECFDYLKEHASLSPKQQSSSEGEVVKALWEELIPDLDELDEYGGGDDNQIEHVSSLLEEIQDKLAEGKIDRSTRRELLEDVLPYIRSGNSGLEDDLYGVAYGACYNDQDWRLLAESLEAMGSEWKIAGALDIYRRLGDHDKYLELRAMRMEYGADYYDLSSFYWETGGKEKAIAVAEEGLRTGTGRMDELREFLSDWSLESGNRERYLQLRFEQTTDQLTLEKYMAFKKICTPEEWTSFEEKIMQKITRAWDRERLEIYMYRNEYDKALAVLVESGYPPYAWETGSELKTAAILETRFPEEILKYYLSGLGNLKANTTRKGYAAKARVMAKVRHMFVDVLKAEDKWLSFALRVKRDNMRWPAFQEEFASAVPGWQKLG